MRYVGNSIFIGILAIIIFSCNNQQDKEPYSTPPVYPFPVHGTYHGFYIKPDNYSQEELDKQTSFFYSKWISQYLRNDCKEDEYYIHSGNNAKTISEAHGYGMMILCYMAGYEKYARKYFDGMFRYYQSHPSSINAYLMDWQQLTCNDVANPDEDDAASDGDIDIAFSLLLADKQWGSDGDINYLEEAKNIISAIIANEINPYTNDVMLGDWCEIEDPEFYFGTRSSDFIPDHFRVFADVTDNTGWDNVSDNCYELISVFQDVYSTHTGLLPDFVVNTNTTPAPAGENYLEDIYDGDYYYNACRLPWRIGTDYLMNGDSRAATALAKINNWLITATDGDASAISNGYRLDGTPLYDWNDPTFLGPFAIAAMLNIDDQEWLNDLYDELLANSFSDGDYYSNTIKLLSMITISGNYWEPL